MVKVYGPMHSMDASGTIGKIATFSKWKGRNYVRARVVPSNPKSGGQVGVRAMFKFLSQIWAGLSGVDQATWEDRAALTTVSPFNAFMGYNQKRWRNWLGPAKVDPATATGTNAGFANISAINGTRQITVQFDNNGADDPWAVSIHRATSGPITCSTANCIAVIQSDNAETYEYVDTPLDVGTYHYHLQSMTDDGLREDVAFDFNGDAE